jgi:hypothetical protein
MFLKARVWRWLVLCTLFIGLVACGGGRGDGGDPLAAPSIGTQPQNTTVSPGAPATFSVVASGGSPLTYQWQRNGVEQALAAFV